MLYNFFNDGCQKIDPSSMVSSNGRIRPNTHVFLRLPTDQTKLIEVKPNTYVVD
jgi:hypothetical protein